MIQIRQETESSLRFAGYLLGEFINDAIRSKERRGRNDKILRDVIYEWPSNKIFFSGTRRAAQDGSRRQTTNKRRKENKSKYSNKPYFEHLITGCFGFWFSNGLEFILI